MKKHYLLCFACFLLVLSYAGAQTTGCGITANAGPDRTLCFPGGSAQLNGAITGEYLGFTWTPIAGMVNPNSLQPTVFVNQTTTYTLNAQSYLPGDNLVVNSDFSQGAVGFTSDYINDPNLIYLPGYYAIVSSPDLIYSNFPPCDDHSPGQGNMMIVDGATNANDDIWCQTIPVTPNTLYAFGAWVGTIVPISVAQIQFLINGQPLGGPISAPLEVCAWTQFFQLWNSGTANSATICIRDLNTANLGNDFGLDDIFFAPACTVSDPVTVTVVQPVATAPFVQFLPCSSGQLTLNAAGSSTGPGYSYQWTTPDGTIVSGANTLSPVVNEAGTYNLTVTYNGGGVTCTATATVIVTGDPATPIAFATPQGQLDCNTGTVTVSGAGSSQGSGFSYQWSTANGSISGSTTTQNIQVTAPGLYQLVVTNTSNGCTATATAQVNFNGVLPVVQAVDSLALTCTQTQVELDGSGSSAGPAFQYLWTTSGGSILSGETTLMPLVDQPGQYTLTVTNTTTGCENALTVTVLDQQEIPFLAIAPPPLISCLDTIVALDASASSNQPGLTFEWSTTDGHFVSNLDSLIVFADSPGQYQLALSNPLTGCADTASVLVTDGRVLPQLSIESPGLLTCTDTLVLLTASDTTALVNTIYQWSAPGGALQGETDTLTAIAMAASWYYLEALDTLSGCLAIDSVLVQADTLAPQADAGTDLTLDCNTSSLQLQGMVNVASGFWSALWTSPDGLIISGETTTNPIVGAPGSYILQAIDSINGCSGLDTVVVIADDDLPLAIIAEPASITCAAPALWLNGETSQYDPITTGILWTSSAGMIQSDPDSIYALVSAPGWYMLQLTNLENGCIGTDSVEVTADQGLPVAEAGLSQALDCGQPEVILDGSGSSGGPAVAYVWTDAQGVALSGIQVSVGQPGWYFLSATDTLNACSVVDSVLVTADFEAPVAEAGLPATLTCVQAQLNLDATASETGQELVYSWTTSGGNIVAGGEGLGPLVDAPGWYVLEIFNTVSGCAATDSVEVLLDDQAPVAALSVAGLLTCQQTAVEVTSQVSGGGGPYAYQWTTLSGQIGGPSDQASLQALAAGTYSLQVTDQSSGCEGFAEATVQADTLSPQADAGAGATLTCLQTTVALQGAVVNTGNLFVQWTTSGGNILSGANSLNPIVDAPGWYVLFTENTSNGCQSADSVWVDADQDYPQAVIAAVGAITCATPVQTLDASGSSQGPPYIFSWTTTDGSFAGGTATLSPQVNGGGTYVLTIGNPQNGCEASASATVAADTLAPQVQAGGNAIFPCNASVYALQGLILNPLPGYVIQWSSPDGQIMGGESTLSPLVGGPGTYQLEVSNPQNGCSAGDAVILLAQGIENVEINLAHPLCPGETGQIEIGVVEGGTAPYAYSVDGGQQYQSGVLFEGLLSGAFDVVVSDAQGCLYSQAVELEEPYPVQVSLPAAIDLRLGETAVLSPMINLPAGQLGWVKWEPAEGLSCSDCLNPLVSAAETRSYRVTVADLNGCTATAEVTVYVDVFLSVYVPNIFSPNADGVNDVFLLFSGKGQVARILKFQVWSRWGDLVFEREDILPDVSAQGWDGTLAGRPMPEGVYGWIARVLFINGIELSFHGDVTLMR
jgi:gliding motility-associated-like protein